MNTITPLTEYVWRSADVPVYTINVPIAKLAERFGIPLACWEEPGLGSVSGFGCRLECGLALLLEELADAPEHIGVKGPTVYADATELIERGIQRSLANVLTGLDLSPGNVTWSQTEAGLQSAWQQVQAARGRTRPQNGT